MEDIEKGEINPEVEITKFDLEKRSKELIQMVLDTQKRITELEEQSVEDGSDENFEKEIAATKRTLETLEAEQIEVDGQLATLETKQ